MKTNLQKTVFSALLSAVICVATFILIPVPITSGYVNFGDSFVILSGIILGPFYAFLSAGIGSALADVLFGFFLYAPATFIIKGTMALVMALLYRKAKKTVGTLALISFSVLCEIIMVVSYFLYEATVMGFGLGAIGAVLGNVVQGTVAVITFVLLFGILKKTKKFQDLI